MSILVGAITGPGPNIDKRLVGKLFVLATIPIDEDIKKLLAMGFWGVAEQLDSDHLLNNLPRINCFITPFGDVSINLDDNQFGMHMAMAVYPVQKWRDSNLGELHMLLCIVEELCHHYWNIEDEVEVNYKVLEVIKRIVPKTEMSDLYNVDWMEKQDKK